MNKKELLYRINSAKTHNKINHLEKQLEKQKDKSLETNENYKKSVNEYNSAVNQSIEKLNQEINSLKEKNVALENENNLYKSIINRIPKFIVRLFSKGNYKLLNKGE